MHFLQKKRKMYTICDVFFVNIYVCNIRVIIGERQTVTFANGILYFAGMATAGVTVFMYHATETDRVIATAP
jgi:hypothetical protein